MAPQYFMLPRCISKHMGMKSYKFDWMHAVYLHRDGDRGHCKNTTGGILLDGLVTVFYQIACLSELQEGNQMSSPLFGGA